MWAAAALGVSLLLGGCGGSAGSGNGGPASTPPPAKAVAAPTTCQAGKAGFVGGIPVPEEPGSGVATLTGQCWAQIAPTPVANLIPGVGTAQIPGGKTPTVQVAWDATDLYVKCNVYAWPLFAASATAPATDDACEFMIGGSDKRTGGFVGTQAHITVAYNSTSPAVGTHGPLLTNLSAFTALTSTQTGEGYMIELTAPWSALGVSAPASGQSYAFDAAVDYNDAQGNYVAYADITGTQHHPCCSTASWTQITLG